MQFANDKVSDTAEHLQGPAACTIVARNYLSHARVLAESFLHHEPRGRFYLLVVDGLPDGVDAGIDIRVIEAQDLDLPEFSEMCFKYDVLELCTAVKPSFLSLLLNRRQEDVVIYFDPDILIMRPLHELKEALAHAGIVLIPHLLEPIPADGCRPSENDILISGAYNLGFIALQKCAEVEGFLQWWREHLLSECRVNPAEGLFVDQRWVDLVPGLFPSTHILRDDTYDVAYWNVHSRAIEKSDDQFLVNGRPLAFFHFSGFDPARREVLSKHQNRLSVAEGSPLAVLLNEYADLHLQHGFETSRKWSYGYSQFEDGMAVSPALRQLYLSLDTETRKSFGNPFRASKSNSFVAWAMAPQQNHANLSPFLLQLYGMRPDLIRKFPDVGGRDRKAFLHWASTQGAREVGYDPQLVREEGIHVSSTTGSDVVEPPTDESKNQATEMPSRRIMESIGHLARQSLKVVAPRKQNREDSRPAAHADPVPTRSTAKYVGMPGRAETRLSPPAVPPMDLNASLYGPLGQLGKKAMSFLLSYHTYYQSNVNLSFSAFMRELAEANEGLAFQTNEINGYIAGLEQTVLKRLADLEHTALKRLGDLERAALKTEQAVAQLNSRFAIRPYMAGDDFGACGDLSKPMGYTLAASTGQASTTQSGFAGLFRGSEAFIAERQRVYLPFFKGLRNVVDLGCGRGEFLRLLAQEGVKAVGVELDPLLVQYCQAQGHQVVEGDALEYLRGLSEDCLDAIFSAQVIEHLQPEQLVDLLHLAQSRLREGGLLIAETVNPENFEALKTFWVDLSHQHPIYPQVLLFLCRETGFPDARIFYPFGGGFTQESYQTAGEYAVVAVA